MSLESQPTTSPETEPDLPEGFTSQEQYTKTIRAAAWRRLEDIEAKKGMTPEAASAYDKSEARIISKARMERRNKIDTANPHNPEKARERRRAFNKRMEFVESAEGANIISTTLDEMVYQHQAENRIDKKLPPTPPLRKPKRK